MSSKNIGYITRCQICDGSKLQTVLSLGHQALISSYLTKEDLHKPETVYPLNLCRCASCGLVQLDYIVPPPLAFHPGYPYHTGMTNMLVRNFRSLASQTIRDFKLNPGELVVDIGSNDGTLLQGFKEAGMRVIGVEPTNAASVARNNGIPTLQTFFNAKVAAAVVKKYGRAKVITCTNAFAHINILYDVLGGIANMLYANGVFISESQYLAATIEKKQFDCIYHEHLRYYTLKPMQEMFKRGGMSITDAERIPAAGGSIRVFAQKGNNSISLRAKKIIADERKAGLHSLLRLKKFARDATITKRRLLSLLLNIKNRGKRIAGIGSPARSNSLLGFTGIGPDILPYTCERRGSPKIGLYTPGTHIPVVEESVLLKNQPDYALLLSWHIGGELIRKLRTRGFSGRFIIPLPTPRIIT